MLLPDKVSVPVPIFVKLPMPVRLPLKSVDSLLLPMLNVTAALVVRLDKAIFRLPEREPSVALVVPLANLSAPLW